MSFAGMLNQTVTIANPSGTRNAQGQAVLGSGVAYRARFERTYKVIATAEHDREPIHGVVFLPAGATVQPGAKLVYDGRNYRVIEVSNVVVGGGSVHHHEAMVQEWGFAS